LPTDLCRSREAGLSTWSSPKTRRYADLLDPKWQGKIVRAHPAAVEAASEALKAHYAKVFRV
jgi:ABC-type Fe3+ transport system substrate-binding protein